MSLTGTLSNRCQGAVAAAMLEALSLCQTHIGTEHLLLGVLSMQNGASTILETYGVTHDRVRSLVRSLLGESEPPSDPLRLTANAEAALSFTDQLAQRLGLTFASPELVVYSLIEQEENVATRIIETLGANLVCIRAEIYLALDEQMT